MKNIALDASHTVKISEFGTAHCKRMFVAPERIGTLYVAPPESFVGGAKVGRLGDSWAVGVVCLALLSGSCPPLEAEASGEPAVFKACVDLLGPITNENWPGHASLSKWKAAAAWNVTDKNTPLLEFLASRPLDRPMGEDHPAIAVVAGLLQWSPQARESMASILRTQYLASLGSVPGAEAASPRGEICQSKEQGCQPSKAVSPRLCAPEGLRRCSGNCMNRTCVQRQNRRRTTPD